MLLKLPHLIQEFKLLTLLMSLIRKNRMKHKKTSQINKIKVQF